MLVCCDNRFSIWATPLAFFLDPRKRTATHASQSELEAEAAGAASLTTRESPLLSRTMDGYRGCCSPMRIRTGAGSADCKYDLVKLHKRHGGGTQKEMLGRANLRSVDTVGETLTHTGTVVALCRAALVIILCSPSDNRYSRLPCEMPSHVLTLLRVPLLRRQ